MNVFAHGHETATLSSNQKAMILGISIIAIALVLLTTWLLSPRIKTNEEEDK